jgi:hypothetical protein
MMNMHFQQKDETLNFFKWGDDIQMAGFSFLGCSDAANSSPVTTLYRKSLPYLSQQAIADLLPVLLSSFRT